MKNVMRRILLAIVAFVAGASLAGETALTVTVLPLGPDARPESTAVGIKSFVSRLDARDSLAAQEAKAPERWDACPAGVKPENWVSLAPVCIGARTDWLAFAFDAEGRPLCAARRPARQYDTAGIYPDSIAPGDKQIDRNAGIELAADLALARPAANSARPRLRVDIAWGEPETQQTMPMMPAEREGIRALAAAAALQAGPAAAETWTLKASKSESGYKLELARPGEPKGLKVRAPREALYPYLVRMIRSLSGWQSFPAGPRVADFMVVEPGGARVMGWSQERVFFDLGLSVIAFNPVEGLTQWTASIEDRYKPAYAWAPPGPDEPGRPYSYHPSIALVGETGVARGPQANESMPWGFSRLKDGGFIVAQDRTLMSTDPKNFTARWKWSGADRLTAGPRRWGDRVLVGGLAGELAAVSLADGSLTWRTSVTARLSGAIVLAPGEPAVALVPSMEGIVFAFTGTGAIAWQAGLGDSVLGELAITPAGVLAATRAGRVALLDPRNGKILASWEAGEAAVGLSVIGEKVCWAGRHGRVAWLALPGLKGLGEVNLRTLLNDGVVTGENIPFAWGSGEEMGMRGQAALVADEEGFAYVLPVP